MPKTIKRLRFITANNPNSFLRMIDARQLVKPIGMRYFLGPLSPLHSNTQMEEMDAVVQAIVVAHMRQNVHNPAIAHMAVVEVK